jgi:hypothetical protein
MNKANKTTPEEKTSKTLLLKPFPFIEKEKYLLKLKNDKYVVAYWENGEFILDYDSDYENSFIDEEIESLIALKDLGL